MPRFDRSLPASFFLCALAVLGLACAGGSSGSSGGSGGAAETGGATGSSGATGSGGALATGGSTGSGGGTAKGGATGSGGATAKGGATGSGGATACASCSLMVASYCQTGTSTTEIKVTVDVQDASITPLSLADVTFRYWFMIGGSDAPMLSIDYAQIGSASITSKFVAVSPALTGANEYLEVGFTPSTPPLTLFGDTGQIQLHAHTASYSSFDPTPTSDYSYRPCAAGDNGSTFASAPTITGYISGKLAWGTEPQ
jgi:Cellulose binding domain